MPQREMTYSSSSLVSSLSLSLFTISQAFHHLNINGEARIEYIVLLEGYSPSIEKENNDPLISFVMKMESNSIGNSTIVEKKGVVTDIVPWELKR